VIHTVATLKAFERDIVATFERGEIHAPVHLAGGNEQLLIDIFREIKPTDWVCGTWRSHLHCLLKGVPPEQVKQAILEGRSISLCFPEYRVICSALVGGIAPIALGLAWAAKRKLRHSAGRVWCFLGDMAARSGIVHECRQYAQGHDLPLRFVIEDNGLSVATDTQTVWGQADKPYYNYKSDARYDYRLTWPHVGTGNWVHM
jgi:TPP-dependent pyruvate/acetoin dehydrogenase alpha subunit